MSEQKLTLMERVKQEQDRRRKAKSIEDSNFSVDCEAIIEEENDLISDLISAITKETPIHKRVVELAEMMGMELSKITEDGDEVYKFKQYLMFINPNKKTMSFNELYSTGTVFNMHVHVVKEANLTKIKKDLSFALFLKGDDETREMIRRDTAALNRAERDD